MHVELLFWEGCPSHPLALASLREQMSALGLEADSVEVVEIESDEQAAREHFVGSPTIRIDGVDAVSPGDQPPALTCRIYRRRDGRISPTPDPADVREALASALGRAGAEIERSNL